MPIILKSIADVRRFRKSLAPKQTLGFVPTMGALHQGHAALLKASKAKNSKTVLSIFVNPTQFNNADDLKKYPVTLEQDLKLAGSLCVDAVWLPEYADLYADDYRFKVSESRDSLMLCGAHRPGHFDGVLTVVLKLLLGLQPTRAYFGEKDFQQLTLVRDMASAFFVPTEIVAVPTVREPDGLAMSSRNVRLKSEERKTAPSFHRILSSAKTADDAKRQLQALGLQADYVEEHWNRRLAAVTLGAVRLIDNVPMPKKKKGKA
jgi:pantoate--beta-alanine ligase